MRVRQVQREGALADSMAVSVLLMQLYIFKFFLCAPPSCQCCRNFRCMRVTYVAHYSSGMKATYPQYVGQKMLFVPKA